MCCDQLRGEWICHFLIIQVHFVNLMSFFYVIENEICFFHIVTSLGTDILSALLSIHTPILPSSSVSLSDFILAVPIRECLDKRSCISSSFPIAILNGTSFFLFGARETKHACPVVAIICIVPEVHLEQFASSNRLIQKLSARQRFIASKIILFNIFLHEICCDRLDRIFFGKY